MRLQILTRDTEVNIRGKASHCSGFSLDKHSAEAYEFEKSDRKSPQYRLLPLLISFTQIVLSHFSKHIYSHLGIVIYEEAYTHQESSGKEPGYWLRQKLENKTHQNSCHHR